MENKEASDIKFQIQYFRTLDNATKNASHALNIANVLADNCPIWISPSFSCSKEKEITSMTMNKADAAHAISEIMLAIASLSAEKAYEEPLKDNYSQLQQAQELIKKIKQNKPIDEQEINKLLSLFSRIAKDIPNSDTFLENRRKKILCGANSLIALQNQKIREL